MKLTKREKQLINGRRKFIKIKRNSERITSFRKNSKKSAGEKKVVDFLNSERILFHREWYFKGLYNHSKTNLLYFDFYLPDYNLCIEYDGKQHYDEVKTESQKINDYLKNAYCLKNNIHFLRIKYTDFENIEILICGKVDRIFPISQKT